MGFAEALRLQNRSGSLDITKSLYVPAAKQHIAKRAMARNFISSLCLRLQSMYEAVMS
jgi:hypothetical protein